MRNDDLALLRAIDNAAVDLDNDGWADATTVRAYYDGGTRAAGHWAKRLWRLESLGLVETRPIHAGRFLWGLTDAGSDALTREDSTESDLPASSSPGSAAGGQTP